MKGKINPNPKVSVSVSWYSKVWVQG